MAGLGERDDELVAKIRNNIRVEERLAWSGLIAFAIISMLFLGVLVFHLPKESTGMVAFAVLLIWIALAFRYQRTAQPVAGPIDEKTLRRTIDDQHHRWRWVYIFIFILVGGFAAMTTGMVLFLAALHLPRSGPPVIGHPLLVHNPLVGVLFPAMYFAFVAVVAALQVCFGPGFRARAQRRALNDEHTRVLQQSAALFGYLLCVILMCAVLVVMVFRPQWGLVIMPGIIAVTVILPGLYFLLLQWRSGRDG